MPSKLIYSASNVVDEIDAAINALENLLQTLPARRSLTQQRVEDAPDIGEYSADSGRKE